VKTEKKSWSGIIIAPEEPTVHQGDAFKDTAFKQGFEIVKF
jgi:hypothetical protein